MAFTKVTGTLVDIGDLDLTNVGQIQLDSIAGDADANTSITFSGSDVITIATGGSGRLTIGDGALSPVTTNQIDLGTSSLEFKDAYFDGTVTADAFSGPLTGTLQTAAHTNITSLGTLTALTVDEMTLNADTLTASDDFIIDAVGDITLDAADNQIFFKDNGTTVGTLSMTDSDLKFISNVNDKDMIFAGTDNNSEITALTLDMSEAGAATFNNKIIATELDISGDVDIDGTLETDALSIASTTITATAAELNYTDGVTSNIQTQLDTKATTGKAIAMALVFG